MMPLEVDNRASLRRPPLHFASLFWKLSSQLDLKNKSLQASIDHLHQRFKKCCVFCDPCFIDFLSFQSYDPVFHVQ